MSDTCRITFGGLAATFLFIAIGVIALFILLDNSDDVLDGAHGLTMALANHGGGATTHINPSFLPSGEKHPVISYCALSAIAASVVPVLTPNVATPRSDLAS
jgi:hypothetical protein